jgi:hypothetical protein
MRFLLDPGSGTCLWRDPAASREAGQEYAIDHHALGLSQNLVVALDALIALADLRIDWSQPTARGPFFVPPVAEA